MYTDFVNKCMRMKRQNEILQFPQKIAPRKRYTTEQSKILRLVLARIQKSYWTGVVITLLAFNTLAWAANSRAVGSGALLLMKTTQAASQDADMAEIHNRVAAISKEIRSFKGWITATPTMFRLLRGRLI